MRVFTYHHDRNDPKYPRELINLWWDSWEEQGFDVEILNEFDSKDHPRYEEINQLVSTFPTINDIGFERACWIRWLAYAMNAPGIFTDYDVINFGLKPGDFTPVPLLALDESMCGALYAERGMLDNFIDFFPQAPKYTIKMKGMDHVSDLYLMEKWFRGEMYGNIGKLLGNKGYMTAPLVHFSNGYVKEGQKFNDRDKAVRELAKIRGVTFPE